MAPPRGSPLPWLALVGRKERVVTVGFQSTVAIRSGAYPFVALIQAIDLAMDGVV
jgi:hypothetical protein